MTPFRTVIDGLNELRIPYYIGGSVASSLHGVSRFTADTDIVLALPTLLVDRFAALFTAEFYVDAGMIRESLHHGSCFNVLHLGTGAKFDFFPLRDEPFPQSQFARRIEISTELEDGPITITLATAEDTILQKLLWFRMGGQVSDRQWNDVVGIARAKQGKLDLTYLQAWARQLRIDDLLAEVLTPQ